MKNFEIFKKITTVVTIATVIIMEVIDAHYTHGVLPFLAGILLCQNFLYPYYLKKNNIDIKLESNNVSKIWFFILAIIIIVGIVLTIILVPFHNPFK